MERDKNFSSLLHSTCEGLYSFFSSESQKKICQIVRKKPYLALLLKSSHLRMTLELKLRMGKFWVSRLGSGLMAIGIGPKFTFFSKISLSRCTARYMDAQKIICSAKNVIRCTKKRIPRLLILQALLC